MDERWLTRSPRTMLETFHWFRGECFHPIVEDLARLPPGPAVVAEGFRLLPHLVRPCSPTRRTPSGCCRRPPSGTPPWPAAAIPGGIPGLTIDPVRARSNLEHRDRMFTDRLTRDVERMGLPAVHLDAGADEDETLDRVARMFGLSSPLGTMPA